MKEKQCKQGWGRARDEYTRWCRRGWNMYSIKSAPAISPMTGTIFISTTPYLNLSPLQTRMGRISYLTRPPTILSILVGRPIGVLDSRRNNTILNLSVVPVKSKVKNLSHLILIKLNSQYVLNYSSILSTSSNHKSAANLFTNNLQPKFSSIENYIEKHILYSHIHCIISCQSNKSLQFM